MNWTSPPSCLERKGLWTHILIGQKCYTSIAVIELPSVVIGIVIVIIISIFIFVIIHRTGQNRRPDLIFLVVFVVVGRSRVCTLPESADGNSAREFLNCKIQSNKVQTLDNELVWWQSFTIQYALRVVIRETTSSFSLRFIILEFNSKLVVLRN